MQRPSAIVFVGTQLIVAVSPAELNLSETLSTLTFGSNAKQIELGKPKKNITKSK